jgi:hypothetical protein
LFSLIAKFDVGGVSAGPRFASSLGSSEQKPYIPNASVSVKRDLISVKRDLVSVKRKLRINVKMCKPYILNTCDAVCV